MLSLCLLVSAAIAWGVFGRIATKVSGVGMLLYAGGVEPVVATRSGRLVEIKVRVGDNVSAGQVVALLVDPDTEKSLEAEKLKLSLLQGEAAKTREMIQQEVKSKQRVLQSQRENIQKSIKIYRDKTRWLDNRLQAYEDLFKQGLALEKDVVETKLDRDNAFVEIDKLEGELNRLSAQEIEQQESVSQRLFQQEFDIEQSKTRVEILENELKRATSVEVATEGTVVSVEGTPGKIVSPGQTIATIEPPGRRLVAQVFVSARQGKMIQPGMVLEIVPTTVTREEYGFMSARVQEVGEYPVSAESMNSVINNPAVVQSAMKGGALVHVKGDLITDPSTRSGYRWSSFKGRSIAVTAGTVCSSEVIVKQDPPITLVIPTLKSWIGS